MLDSLSSRPEFITTNQAAILHDVTPATVRSWVIRGLLKPHAKVYGANVYRLADVDRAEMEARKRDKTRKAQTRLT